MYSEKYTANTQYNDMTGTAAFDDGHFDDIKSWAKVNGYLSDTELLIGIDIFGHSITKEDDYVVSLKLDYIDLNMTSNIDDYIKNAENSVILKRKDIDVPITEILPLFKQFNIRLTTIPQLLDNVEVSYQVVEE